MANAFGRPLVELAVVMLSFFLINWVDPRKLSVGVKYYVCTFLHTSKSHSAAPGMHPYSARELRAKVKVALLLFSLHFS